MFETIRKPRFVALAAACVLAAAAAPAAAHKTSTPHKHGLGKAPAGWTATQSTASYSKGRVNVVLGPNVTLNNVKVGHAARIVAAACGTKVGPQAVKVVAVKRTGVPAVLCTAEFGEVSVVSTTPPPTTT